MVRPINAPKVTAGARGTHLACQLRLLSSLLIAGLTACGGGGGSTLPPPPPTPDFSLAVSPTSQMVNGGSSASVSLSATSIAGFSSQITVQVAGLPAGVSVSPASITLVPGTPQQVKFSAPANAAFASAAVTFTGTEGALSHSAGLNLSVDSTFGSPGRTRYVRTDATTEYFLWPNQNWIIYNPITSRFFVTDPTGNHVIAMDAASETEISTISVPGAYGIDDTPDHTLLYVATLVGDVYTIDPVSMTVTQRYPGSQIGPRGYLPFEALVLADGQVALLGSSGGILSVGGSINFAIWNPANNSFTLYGGNGKSLPCISIFGFSRTVDRTKVIVSGSASPQKACEVDESTGAVTEGTISGTGTFITTPDGKYIIVADTNEAIAAVNIYDANTLALVENVNLNVPLFSAEAYVASADSTTLFLLTDTIIYAYSLTTGQQIGWVPNIFLPPSSGGLATGPVNSPLLQAVDVTGLFAGPLEEGVGFVDLSALQSLPVGTPFTNAYLNPAAGPLSGGTQAQWGSVLAGMQGSVYFGNQRSTSLTTTGDLTTAATPPASPGPVTVYAFSTDGGLQMIPEGFSYGPTILEVTPNMATAEGGGTGYIYGYGLGPVNATSIPPDLQVIVGGAHAQVTAFSPNAYGLSSPPFQLEFAAYTVPQGVAGSADVTVTNDYGSRTAPGAFTYLPATQQFPLAGSTLAQGVYDPYTDLYYFTDTNRIQVFSRVQGQWMPPIAIPAPQGATQRLWGIALSPDGSKLAVSDSGSSVIYLFDPTNPTSVKTFSIGPQNGWVIYPCGVAVSDAGNIYYWVFGGADGADQFFMLNTTTGVTTDYDIDGPSDLNNQYLRVMISSDNTRVFFNEEGNVFWFDATGTVLHPASVETNCCAGDFELALSSNQTQITATSYFYDFDLKAESYYALNDREILNIADVYGAKFSPDGRLLFQPSTNGIDVFDGELGNLLNRISLPVALSSNYDALVDDGTDNILVAITGTGNGVAIVDLTSISEPPPLTYNRKSASRKYPWANRLDSLADVTPSRQQEHPLKPSRIVPHVTRSILPNRKQAVSPGSHAEGR
jgi:hypothetical protein